MPIKQNHDIICNQMYSMGDIYYSKFEKLNMEIAQPRSMSFFDILMHMLYCQLVSVCSSLLEMKL